MLKENIIRKYEKGSILLIDSEDDEIRKLIEIIAVTDISILRHYILKSIDFVCAKIIQLHQYYSIPLKEIRAYAADVVSGRDNEMMHNMILSYLYHCTCMTNDRYAKSLLHCLHSHIASLYQEHRYVRALLYEYSSAFHSLGGRKQLEQNYNRIEESLHLSIEDLKTALGSEHRRSSAECRMMNSEFIRIYNEKRKDGKKREVDIKAEERRKMVKTLAMTKRRERCIRVSVIKVMPQVMKLKESLSRLEKEHLRRYYLDLFEDVRCDLTGKDRRYERLFISIAACYRNVEKKKESKRKLRFAMAQLTGYAMKRGPEELKKAKIVPPALFESIDAAVKEDEMKLIFDSASNNEEKAKMILTRELERIERTRREASYPRL